MLHAREKWFWAALLCDGLPLFIVWIVWIWNVYFYFDLKIVIPGAARGLNK